ncbi:MAG: FAD-binding protein [Deltaproteobacteria bacterium]|nr:FAD-binding protein [Candidatus Zymogenaceae bacterium]
MKRRFAAVDTRIIELLTSIVGEQGVVVDPHGVDRYCRDETTDTAGRAEVVVKPRDTAAVAGVVKLASEFLIPITPRGGGTGVTGGAVPAAGGIVLSLEKMNRIIEIDTDNLMAVAEPCVITGDLARAAAERGLFYPPDPASIDSCALGGNVAEGAGGPCAVKYGTTGDYVTGLVVVFPDGSVSRLGGKIVKNATGYNLIGLFVGSEGTLGVITEITVRLLPLPLYSVDLMAPFADLASASSAVSAVIRARIVPTTIEFIEKEAITLASRFLKKDLPFPDAGAQLLIRLDGDTKQAVDHQMERLWETIKEKGARDMIVAESSVTRDRLWEGRRCMREAVVAEGGAKCGEDVVVPRAAIPAFVGRAKEHLADVGIGSIFFGHAGDGNIHVELMKGKLSDDEWRRRLPAAREGLYRIAVAAGGMITGEHGIGLIRKEYLGLSLDSAQIAVMRHIKDALDPKGIMNPEKIFHE